MKRFIGKFASVALLLVLMSASAWAQATAQLSGTVRDQSGAVLPGTTVTVTQTDTGFTRTAVTDGTGDHCELRCRQLRPDPDPGWHSAHPAVRDQI